MSKTGWISSEIYCL